MRCPFKLLMVATLSTGLGTLAIAQQAGTVQLPEGQTPPDVFGPAQVELLDNCLLAHGTDGEAVGDCVTQGLLRQWADYAVGRQTRECIENPDHCSLGRLLTDPEGQIDIWRDRWVGKFDQLEQDAQNLIDIARNPKEELKKLEGDLNAAKEEMEAELARWMGAVENPGQALKDLERTARDTVDTAVGDVRAEIDRTKKKIADLGDTGGDVVGGISRIGDDIGSALEDGRDELRDLVDDLKDLGKLPLFYDIEPEVLKAQSKDALDSLKDKVKRESEAWAEGKPTLGAADAIINALMDVEEEFDRLMDEGLLPAGYRLSLPDPTKLTLNAVNSARDKMRTVSKSYGDIVTGAQQELRGIARDIQAAAEDSVKKLRDTIKRLIGQGFLLPGWKLDLPVKPTLKQVENGWKAVEQAVGQGLEAAQSQGERLRTNAQRVVDDATQFVENEANRVATQADRSIGQINDVVRDAGGAIADFGGW